jgi:hypothetical protein
MHQVKPEFLFGSTPFIRFCVEKVAIVFVNWIDLILSLLPDLVNFS